MAPASRLLYMGPGERDVSDARHTSPTAAEAAFDTMATQVRNRVVPWLQTREGLASAGIAAVVLWILWAPLKAPLVADLLAAAFVIVLVSLGARVWESRTAPPPPAFSLSVQSSPGHVVVARDRNAGFWRDQRGFLWDRRVWFAGTGCPPSRLRPQTYRRLRAWSEESDLPVFIVRRRDRQCWWWRGAFYWEAGDYERDELRSLLLMLERDDLQGLAWELKLHPATPIPEDVRCLVFTRDGGRCLVCGSNELIQYAHVVPQSRGGSSHPHNVHLVCAKCNRGHPGDRGGPPPA
jgi:HNH endonuclease